jgi:predicted DCC family thiol-disulfide oxidoreductase YuxK
MKSTQRHTDQSIIFFDGVCNLCEGFVQWVIKRDPDGYFHFSSLQSDFARSFFESRGSDLNDLNSVILYNKGRFYKNSDVSLEVFKQLKFPWSLLYPFKVIPRIIRDSIYQWIAKNRYRWFGKKEQCMIPTPELQSRFLD